MARQKSILKIEGTIDDLNFVKTEDGFLVRRKGGVAANRVATDPAFARTRENNSEFGRAGKGGKLLRTALRALLLTAADGKMVSRLTQAMARVIKADSTSPRGQRNIIDGEVELLQGFDFNLASPLTNTLFAPYLASIDRASGTATVSLPAFVPASMVSAPAGATHFRLLVAGAEVDFEAGAYQSDAKESPVLPWTQAATQPINLQVSLPANSTHPLFLALGIEFMQEVNGQQYPLQSGSYNACTLVKVSGV